MKRIRTAQELYGEILKSLYFGIYQREGHLMTYQEMRETYHLSKDTIGRAYAKLRRDGFIRTDGTNGTIVTFDRSNPAHVAKVPLEWPQPDFLDTAPYAIAMRLHGNTLCTGLICSNEEQLWACQERTEEILRNIRAGPPIMHRCCSCGCA